MREPYLLVRYYAGLELLGYFDVLNLQTDRYVAQTLWKCVNTLGLDLWNVWMLLHFIIFAILTLQGVQSILTTNQFCIARDSLSTNSLSV